MDANVACYFAGIVSLVDRSRGCDATELAPEERVKVEREKYVNGTLPGNPPQVLTVCYECADRGWDEIIPSEEPEEITHDGHPPTWPGYIDNRDRDWRYNDQMPGESTCYPLDR